MQELQFTKLDIQQNFDRGDYNRGVGYFRDGSVLSYELVEHSSGAMMVLSEVEGNYIYSQEILISGYRDSIKINADCSCPVGHNCKHSVAVLLQLLENGVMLQHEDKAEVWLDTFLALSEPEEPAMDLLFGNTPDEMLHYRLFHGHGDDVKFYKVQRAKRGGYTKGREIHSHTLFQKYSYDYGYMFIPESEKQLIGELKTTRDIHYQIRLEGRYGAYLLQALCETGRAFLRDSTEPLHFDADRTEPLHFVWKESGDGVVLAVDIAYAHYLISRTVPPMCIDLRTQRLFALESNYSIEEIKMLQSVPKMSESQAASVSEQLALQRPQKEIAMPRGYSVEALQITPVPYLCLSAQPRGDHLTHLLKLQFLYGVHSVEALPPHPFEMIREGDKRLKLIRDSEIEREALETIDGYGFVYSPPFNAYLSYTEPGMQAAIERWRLFLEEGVPSLRDAGWQVEIDESFAYRFEAMGEITVESSGGGEVNPWFELSFSLDIGGRSLSLVPIAATLLREFDSVEALPPKLNIEIEEGHFLHIESAEVAPVLKMLFELYDKVSEDRLILNPYDTHLMEFDAGESVVWKGVKELQALSQKLKSFEGIERVSPEETLCAELREYQQFGLSWLHFLHSFSFAGILADDMGLGKTIQTLAFLQTLKVRGEMTKPTLVVMPTSLIGNWKNEIEKFTPELRYLSLYGADRAEKFARIQQHDIILTTYALVQRDKERYEKVQFFYIILDEAQKIKNPRTKMAQTIKGLRASHRLALTGTPIENHLGELWSIFDFLMPGFLGSLTHFKTLYQTPIEQENDIGRGTLLKRKVGPFVLRRTKDEVVSELPPKTEIVKKAIFSPKQAKLYESIRVAMEKKVREAIAGKGLSRSHITILDALTKLRQVCCDPSLLKLEGAKKISESAKLDLFLELIEELHAEGKKVLVFSQFTSMLSILEAEIKKRKIRYTKLTGATRKREEAIAKFTGGDAEVFLISLKAGGVGLNLVEADTVIHYDPWWNPAVENQATDRAYRIGQDKAVFVYKLIVEHSIEEQILKLQEKKKSLQQGIQGGKEDQGNHFGGEELAELLKL